MRPVKWDSGTRDQLLVASFEGIALYRASGNGDAMKFEKQLLSSGHVEKAPRLGTSDVAVGTQRGKRFLASVEPWRLGAPAAEWHRGVVRHDVPFAQTFRPNGLASSVGTGRQLFDYLVWHIVPGPGLFALFLALS